MSLATCCSSSFRVEQYFRSSHTRIPRPRAFVDQDMPKNSDASSGVGSSLDGDEESRLASVTRSRNNNNQGVFTVEAILDKREYNSQDWVLIKWEGYEEPTWELQSNCSCELLLEEYEKQRKARKRAGPKRFKNNERNLWEVDEILEKKTVGENVQYLIRWKGWPGDPTWEPEANCIQYCPGLIARFENPRLRRLLDFSGNNQDLWVSQPDMIEYLKNLASKHSEVNFLEFEPDIPENECPPGLRNGLNLGAIIYEKHWHLVIILVNHITVTKHIMICDPLNVLIGPWIESHPIFKRLQEAYSGFTIEAIRMTQMSRSDMCAFYTIAAFVRSIFLFSKRAPFVVNEIRIDRSVAERLVDEIKPEVKKLSVSLPLFKPDRAGTYCEFCKDYYNTPKRIDTHIRNTHFTKAKL